uniref:Secreted protein n=1 Tax=Musa acuminata subsp. malaccensis TaxID=214687 RepID=A0A804IDT4_MUSAM
MRLCLPLSLSLSLSLCVRRGVPRKRCSGGDPRRLHPPRRSRDQVQWGSRSLSCSVASSRRRK